MTARNDSEGAASQAPTSREQPPSPGAPVPGETPVDSIEIGPGIRRRQVLLSDGRYMLYYEFARRGELCQS